MDKNFVCDMYVSPAGSDNYQHVGLNKEPVYNKSMQENNTLTVKFSQIQKFVISAYSDILSDIEDSEDISIHLDALGEALNAIVNRYREGIAQILRRSETCLLIPGFDEQHEIRITDEDDKVVMVFVGDEIKY